MEQVLGGELLMLDLTKYFEVGFNTLMKFGGGPVPYSYCAGFFCQGPESMTSDGLVCYINLEGEPEKRREKYLSPCSKTPQKAIDQAYQLFCEASVNGMV